MPPSDVVAVTSMRDYFRAAVDTALAYHALAPSAATAAYLVELLCEYARQQRDLLSRPLTRVFAAADVAAPGQSFQQLKEVGDQSLYVAGYFNDSLPRLKLDLEYFVELGSSAYLRLSRMLQLPHSTTRFVVVFSELGDKFIRFVHVLHDVRRLGD